MIDSDLRLILNGRNSLVVLETYDELRALDLLTGLFQTERIPAWQWTITEGIRPLGYGLQMTTEDKHDKPADVLNYIKACEQPSAFVLCDFHSFLEDEPKHVRYLKDIALKGKTSGHKVILLSHSLKLPPELSRMGASVSLSLPDESEILAIIREEARLWAKDKPHARIKTDNVTLKKLVNNLLGLSHSEVRRLAHGAIADDGAITESDLPEVSKAKFELMDMDGVLHFEYSTAHLKDVGGLSKLKDWLQSRRSVFIDSDPSDNLDIPKGVMLFGVQGGGKSLAAKSIAGIWGVPLLRMDMGALFNKFIGETEKNLREALKLADLMSPCVLWLDEIEKGLSSESSDGGVAKRLLGTLLTWMAERTSRVFLVATSNNISVLPPELLRKGRFDEIFFIDLPDQTSRETIFGIHLEKRKHNREQFDLRELANIAQGFTGAEIEQAVVSACYSAKAQNEAVKQHHIIHALHATQPLSIVMAEQIASLQHWAKDRAVKAN